MNASELADKLSDKTMSYYILFQYLPEIVSMLRKQQESIEGLTRDYDLLFAEHQLLRKKEWVSLTEEDDIDWEEGGSLRDLVEAIEAKLKEKNS